VPVFERLKVWEKAHELTLYIYRVTEKFPSEERYGLTSQMRRAAYSVPANIAEGDSRATKKDFANFISHAQGSLAEIQYFSLLCRDLELLPTGVYQQIQSQSDEIGRMLGALRTKLLKKS